MLYSILSIAVLGASFAAAGPASPSYRPAPQPIIRHYAGGDGDGKQETVDRAATVKEAFLFAWTGYHRFALPADELRPVNNSYRNPRNGWGASAADALSTALVMEIPSIVNQIVCYIPTIDWSASATSDSVSLFETTIRYMGGLLSGYDLLSGPLAHLASAENKRNIPMLLEQAKNLANNMSYAFETPTGIPNNNLYLNTRSTDGSTTNGLATIGTLVLEWTHLSDLTGNETYGRLAQRGESYLLQPSPVSSPKPLRFTEVRSSTAVASSPGRVRRDHRSPRIYTFSYIAR